MFKSAAVTENTPRKGFRKLYRDLEYVYQKGIIISVPRGFVTNGASIPRFFWRLWHPLDNDTLEPAILHDYLYSRSSCLRCSRKEADKIFLNAMISKNVGKLKRNAFYYAVRLFAGGHFER